MRNFALDHPTVGYKRLAWWMVDANVACLRPHQVHRVLAQLDLLGRRGALESMALKRPKPAERPDEQWHIDLMYVGLPAGWFYLVDILDAYSRYLVHWSLNPTMTTDTVTLTVQEALDGLADRRDGEPKIVHDSGSQFVGREWRTFVGAVGLTDIRTRVAHPQSNGRLERLHRTHREEALLGEATESYHAALDAFTRHAIFYNTVRPHTALNYLPPVVYYRGDPEEHRQARESKLARALEARRTFWSSRSSDLEDPDPYHR